MVTRRGRSFREVSFFMVVFDMVRRGWWWRSLVPTGHPGPGLWPFRQCVLPACMDLLSSGILSQLHLHMCTTSKYMYMYM